MYRSILNQPSAMLSSSILEQSSLSRKKKTESEVVWSERTLTFRLDMIERFRSKLVLERDEILSRLSKLRPLSSRAELTSSELIPLLDNCNFLQNTAPEALKPKKLGRRGQPAWLFGVDSVVHREALGRILIVGPGNYPLFLPMVQAVYAWAAGNSVWMKSAPGTLGLHSFLRDLFLSIGGSAELFRLLGEDNESYSQALIEGVSKVVVIGSAETGEKILAQAGQALVPAVAELSGWDAVFVHPEADLERAASAIAFGLALNGGHTCVAPRRIFFQGDLNTFEEHLSRELLSRSRVELTPSDTLHLERSIDQGCRALGSDGLGPVVLSRVGTHHPLLQEAEFGSLAVLCVVENDEQALDVAARCPYALGASLFGPSDWCEGLGHRVPGHIVTFNDLVVPAADPRLPFGGSGRSGFGRMRGREGLLEMTQTRVISAREGGAMDHLRVSGPSDDDIIERFLLLSHAPHLFAKMRALMEMVYFIGRERVRRRRAARHAQRGVSEHA